MYGPKVQVVKFVTETTFRGPCPVKIFDDILRFYVGPYSHHSSVIDVKIIRVSTKKVFDFKRLVTGERWSFDDLST